MGLDGETRDLLREHLEEIVSDWEVRVAARLGEDEGPALRDHVPKLLDAMLECDTAGSLHRVPEIGQMHAWTRARQGWDVQGVACELSELRSAIWTVYADVAETSAVPTSLVSVVERVLGQFSEMTLSAFVAHQRRSLEESEARLRAVIDHAPSVIYVKEPPEFRYRLVNQAFLDLFGISRDEALGRTDEELAGSEVGPEAAAWRAHDAHVLDTGESIVVEEHLVHRGTGRVFLTVKFPLSIGGGPPSVCGISTEVTAQKRLESARERFVGVLGHDLRNPVTAISMTAALLLRRGGLDADQQRLVRRIADSSDRIGRLAADLLDVTRSTLGGGLQIHRRPADLCAIGTLVVDEIRAAHPDRRIGFESRGDTTGEWDPDRVAQALSNLVANAVQHGEDPIRVSVIDQGDEVCVQVANAGAPIPAEDLPRLFEPFTHLTNPKGARSIGLGLGIVNAIASAHRAEVHVASDTERGTVFTIRWPRTVPAEPG